MTLWPTSAKQAPVTRPTYPEPIIEISMNQERCGRISPSTSGGIPPAFPRQSLLWDHSPDDEGSKFKSKPNFGNALSVTVNRRPYSFTPELSRITPPNEATQLVRSR